MPCKICNHEPCICTEGDDDAREEGQEEVFDRGFTDDDFNFGGTEIKEGEGDLSKGEEAKEESKAEDTKQEEEEKPAEESTEKKAEEEVITSDDKSADTKVDNEGALDIKDWLKDQPSNIQKHFNDLKSQVGLYKGRAAQKIEDVLKDAGIDPALVGKGDKGDQPKADPKDLNEYDLLNVPEEVRDKVDEYRQDAVFKAAMQAEAFQLLKPLLPLMQELYKNQQNDLTAKKAQSRTEREADILKVHKDAENLLGHKLVKVGDATTIQFHDEDFQTFFDNSTEIEQARFYSKDTRDTIKMLDEYKASKILSSSDHKTTTETKKNKVDDSYGPGDRTSGSKTEKKEKSESEFVDEMIDSRRQN